MGFNYSFREVRDQIEQKILDWLEHPEEVLAKLREERELERPARMETAWRDAEVRAQKPTSQHAQDSRAWRALPERGVASVTIG